MKIFAASRHRISLLVGNSYYSNFRILPFIGCLFAIVLFYYAIIRFSLNFPIYDDYVAILQFLLDFKNANTLNEKWRLIWQQHNEHRIVFSKLVTLVQYGIDGTVSFRKQILIGNLGLLLIWFSLLYYLKRQSYFSWWLMMPVTLFLFQFQYYELSFFAMAANSGIWVLGFACCSLYFLEKNSKAFDLCYALAFAIICTFTQGNGWFVFPAGIVLLLIKRGSKREMSIWGAAGVLILIAYLIAYKNVMHSGQVHGGAASSILYHFLETGQFFLTLVGAGFNTSLNAMLFWGAILFCFMLMIIIVGRKKLNGFGLPLAILLFVLLSLLAAAYARAPLGQFAATAPRYRINNAMIYALLFLNAIAVFPALRKELVVLPVVAVAAFFTWRTYENKIRWMLYEEPRTKQFIINARKGLLPENFNYFWNMPDRDYPVKILDRAAQKGVYDYRRM